ncbi:flagellin N-terminal helical domain-containing protein [Blastococcus sp. VKM Ac-2987]|uniref:flagellin N-terminal helical domain-containing protein n=1 Tax=Blastococcus sp. VKM Ac-2987 TaxID=3004141 RepID=UPI0022AB9AD1|nr:flagellin [Blastococcus sp. VKM Ac-2987]MCZ2858049.1 flagellin [Blastococcus sp. VKM Ac-2987]
MGLRVNNNIAALNAYRNLSVTDNQMSKSLEKLSSGFRINRAADDAAGLAISEGLRSQIGGLKVAVRNTQDGVSVVQTAEGALTETHSILQRMRDLSVQASNAGGLNDDAKGNIQSEISQLKSELTRIADTTTFNGTKLLDGSYAGNFQVGANAGEKITVKVGTDMSAAGLKIDGLDVTLAAAADALTGAVGTAASHNGTTGTAGVATVGAANNYTLAESFDKLNGTITVGDKSLDLSTVKFADGSTAAQRTTAIQTALTDAGVGATVANTATGLTFTTAAPTSVADVPNKTISFASASGADLAITQLDEAIKTVSTTRADLGALQNRFDHTINNLNVTVENLTASESRIRDADMAQEMVQFTRNQILSQAGTSMLAQANQASQGVLSLLR